MTENLHERPAVRQLGIRRVNQSHSEITPVLHSFEQGPVVNLARVNRRNGDRSVRVPRVINRLQTNQQIARAAQTDDLLPAIGRMRADLDHTLPQGKQAGAWLSLREKNLALTETHILKRVVNIAVQLGFGELIIVNLKFEKRAVLVSTRHRFLRNP